MAYLLPSFDLNFQELVNSFFLVESIHDCEIDDTTQVDQVRFGAIFNRLRLFLG
jgi:hypothetical protein